MYTGDGQLYVRLVALPSEAYRAVMSVSPSRQNVRAFGGVLNYYKLNLDTGQTWVRMSLQAPSSGE